MGEYQMGRTAEAPTARIRITGHRHRDPTLTTATLMEVSREVEAATKAGVVIAVAVVVVVMEEVAAAEDIMADATITGR
ncbi:hypothetical protein ColKHC_10777 [Colletotrichum higginsianum]|nr:hypothetical protein ColKHC_10777 [Colletotrichum higginsianum]